MTCQTVSNIKLITYRTFNEVCGQKQEHKLTEMYVLKFLLYESLNEVENYLIDQKNDPK